MSSKEYLKAIQRSWDVYGKEDPLWAIATDPAKAGNKWDEEEFFTTGRAVVERMMRWCDANGFPVAFEMFLDFGCGVGRLTQSFAEHFKKCIGVDIAPSMIVKAKEYNKHGTMVSYVLNECDDLSLFKDNTFDMVYTEHVLQHMHPSMSKRYISEMIRVLRPGGLLAFHVPSALARFVYPEEGLSAKIEIDAGQIVMKLDEVSTMQLTIHNTGSVSWMHQGTAEKRRLPLRIMNRWYDIAGEKLLDMFHHQTIPVTMHPGESYIMAFKVHPPEKFGHYVAIFDVIDFYGVGFSSRGNPVASLEVVVKQGEHKAAPAAAVAEAEESFRPSMEMHAISIDEVKSIVQRHRGRMIEIEHEERPPDENAFVKYFITKDR